MSISLIISFILIPLLCAIVAGCGAGFLGCLLAWRRLIYFGEALAHSSLLGIALALYLGLPLSLGIWLITLLLIALLFILKQQQQNDPSSILGSLSHLSLALGLILIMRMETIRTDLSAYLFGDILATTWSDLILIILVTGFSLLALKFIWQKIILLTSNPQIASCEIKHHQYIDLAFLLILGTYVATMVQFFGLLLVISLLIIPANTANKLAKTPEQSACLAVIIAVVSATIGTVVAWSWNLPLAPAMVVVAGFFYFVSVFYTFLRKNR